jgi:RHH-type rel operon transcriptional repressor/antitoxin RelB
MVMTVRLPEGLERRLEILATKSKRSKSYYVKEALLTYLEDLEDIAAIKEYEKQPVSKGYTTNQTRKMLGLSPLKTKRTRD